MLALAGGTVSIFLTHCLLAFAFLGIGLLVRRAFGLRDVTLDDCFTGFWMGFAFVILFLMLWHFVLPVGPGALGVVLATGLCGLVVTRSGITNALRDSRLSAAAVVGAVLFSLWVANLSLGRLVNWDSALYHVQGVKWFRTYAIVPGLANVFGPLAFNNSSLLYDAMLDTGPWSGRAWHVANGVLVSAFGVQALLGAAQLLKRRTSASPAWFFALLLLPSIVDCAVTENVSSFSTAAPASLVLMAAITRGYLVNVDESRSIQDKAYDFVCIAVLAAIGTAIKSSAAVFAAAILVVSVYGILRHVGSDSGLRRKALVWIVVSIGAIGTAWCARGIILSGYPLFPSQVFGLPVDWRVPAEHARAELEFVEHSARSTAENIRYVSGAVSGPGAWLRHWVRVGVENLYDMAAPLGLAAVSAVAAWRLRRREHGMRGGWWMLGPILISLGAWFVIAPMPRYATAFLWSLGALLGSQAFRLARTTEQSTRWLILGACLVGFSPCVVDPVWVRVQFGPAPGRPTILGTVLKFPTPGHWYEIGEPSPQLTSYTTSSGVVLNVPVGYRGRCWDAPLPCTPNPAPNLRLRSPGRIEKGFAVDGAWQMINWPQAWRPDLLPAMREGWRKRDSTPR